MEIDPLLFEHLERRGQSHLFQFWDALDALERARLLSEIQAVDFDRLHGLVTRLVHAEDVDLDIEPGEIEPIDVVRLPETDGERALRRRSAGIGGDMLASGEVAIVLVAGGSGTRLGFEGPKGTFPIGPVSSASLFQIHAEKVLALSRRHGRSIPLYIMTSPDNHEATIRFFEAHDRFGLEHVRCFMQGRMPAVDRSTGRVLMASRSQLALTPDGHGGVIAALASRTAEGAESCLEEMQGLGIKTVFYFQVDNPLVRVADPTFLGLHREHESEMSFKVIERLEPEEKLGVIVRAGGRPRVIEYSDLTPELAARRLASGALALWAGSIAVHILEVAFLERLSRDSQLPFHKAIKKTPHVDDRGVEVRPEAPNAVKFEQFIFDALPEAGRALVVETDRASEFEPLKNAVGPESPATVHQRMSDQFGAWLEQAGAIVSRRSDGSVAFGVEISPLFALDAAELKSKIEPGWVVERPVYLR